jgi:hypothetical protein
MIDIIKQISTHQADLIKSFAVFYLLILSNYVSGLFTCNQINFLLTNKSVQVGLAFMLFYFLVTVVSDTGHLEFTPPLEKLYYTFLYFFLFLFTTRLDFRVMTIVLFLIFVIYFIELNKNFYQELGPTITNPEEQEIYEANQYWITINFPFKLKLFKVEPSQFVFLNKVETIIYYIIIVLLVLGFIAYGGEIRDTLHNNKNLSWTYIFDDTKICKIQERKSFIYYLNQGLGVKIFNK